VNIAGVGPVQAIEVVQRTIGVIVQGVNMTAPEPKMKPGQMNTTAKPTT
jgi:hypothetical protein